MKKQITRVFVAAFAIASVALVAAQAENTIKAEFATAPADGNSFSVSLVNTGKADVAGFAFRVYYDPSQVSITGVEDITGQPASKVQYTLGAETATNDSGTSAQRVLTATTLSDLKSASKLVQINFNKKPGYTAPFKFALTDRTTTPVIDGLQGSSLQNIPHTFDTSAVNK